MEPPPQLLKAVRDAHRNLMAGLQVGSRHDVVCDLGNAEVYIELAEPALALGDRHYAHGIGERCRDRGSPQVFRMRLLLRDFTRENDVALGGAVEYERRR